MLFNFFIFWKFHEFSKNSNRFFHQKIFEIDIFGSHSEFVPQKTLYKLVYEINFEKSSKTGPPYCFINLRPGGGLHHLHLGGGEGSK